ncbi:hypothetical protein DCAR_0832121 [Daucus carota subsp. sativus]|uniref:Response regulatory domain-containing protein n=1 Tax=Daucus carota subsp. sativus TaxID=79200 RepID=A0AAF0XQW9_DAUCS|nr:hypothetical protein DCAR_0832121 [Daucus carota subsp. sativus]
MLSNNSYDLILAEVHMPGMNGVELLQHINRDFSLPVICKSLYYNIYKNICITHINSGVRFISIGLSW